jgi:hypothetical protein
MGRYKLIFIFYRISETQYTLSLAMQNHSTHCRWLCRITVPTVVGYAEFQYRLLLREKRAWLILNVYLSLLSLVVEMFARREHQMWRLLFDAASHLPTTCEPMKWEVFVFCFQVIPLFVHDVTDGVYLLRSLLKPETVSQTLNACNRQEYILTSARNYRACDAGGM